MRCPNCGADLPDTAQMCYSCRKEFGNSKSEGRTDELKGPSPQIMGPDPTIFERQIPSKQALMQQNSKRQVNSTQKQEHHLSPFVKKLGIAFLAICVVAYIVITYNNKNKEKSDSSSGNQSSNTTQNTEASNTNNRLSELSKYDTVSASGYEKVLVDDVVVSKDGDAVTFVGEIKEVDLKSSDHDDYYENRDFYDQTLDTIVIKAYVKDSVGSPADVSCTLRNLKRQSDFKPGDKVTISGTTYLGSIKDGYVTAASGDSLQYTKDEFVEACNKLSYDDLLNYPDTHRGEKTKIKAKVVKVDEAGVISNYCYYCQIDGKYFIVRDIRQNQEPRIQEGNTITVYGYANGLTTLKEKEVDYYFGVIDKTVDKYEVPDIYLMFVDK